MTTTELKALSPVVIPTAALIVFSVVMLARCLMQCPFRYRRRWTKFSFGVDPGFVDFVIEQDDRAEHDFNERYPTCWKKFLHWLGRR